MKGLALALSLGASILGGAADSGAQGRSDRITVPLSDPSRPVTLDVHLFAGIVDVTATQGREIVIEAFTPAGVRGAGRAGRRGAAAGGADTRGLTPLQQPTALAVEESNNVVTVRGPRDARVDLTIQVPVRTNFKLKKTAVGSTLGTVTVRGVDGDLEIHTEGGTVTLIDVSGSVVAHSTGGSVVASMRRVTADRPMAFTSYSGNVDVTLPPSTRADLLLRSGLGDIFTAFEVKPGTNASVERAQSGGFRRSGNQPLRATVNGGGPEFELRTYAGNVYLRKGN